MLYKTKFHTEINDLPNFTLIVPSVSIGNVPQLTCDLLITTFEMRKIATIWHPALVACVGADAFTANSSNQMTTACELFATVVGDQPKLATLQIRSGLRTEFSEDFYENLSTTITQLHLSRIVLLASSFDYELSDITGCKTFYCTNDSNGLEMILHEAVHLKRYKQSVEQPDFLGFAPKFYKYLLQETASSLPATVLIQFVSEGDNRPEALNTIELLVNLLKQVPDVNFPQAYKMNVKEPYSWQLLFGGPPPEGLLF